jgi:hypothetical protein
MKLKFTIRTTHPAPQMSQDSEPFFGTTEEAVAAAAAQHAKTGRTVALCDSGVYCWRLWQGGKVTLNRLTSVP